MKLFRAISSIFLATLVLLASSSFFVDVHTCGGAVKAIAILDKADGCGHQALPPCHRKAMKGCCENEQVIHESQEIKGGVTTISLPTQVSTDIIHNTQVLAEIIPAVAINPTSYFSDHPPTLYKRDIIISVQSFLI